MSYKVSQLKIMKMDVALQLCIFDIMWQSQNEAIYLLNN